MGNRISIMNKQVHILLYGSLAALFGSCAPASPEFLPVNKNATAETKTLYRNLEKIRHSKTLFGHQDDQAYGVTWRAEEGRSDVKEVTGSYPAVFGYELGDLERDSTYNLDRVNFSDMKRWIQEGHKSGGVITLSWHFDNAKTDGSSWDTTRTIDLILPGGEKHAVYKTWLDKFAAFNADLIDQNGKPIPVVLRPLHENTGAWFWWGRTHCSPEEYKALWRFTQQYLHDVKKANNLLWAWSPAEHHLVNEFELWYPGDDVVDIIGLDDYGSWNREGDVVAEVAASLGWLVEKAEEHRKIPIFAETGSEGLRDSTWFTQKLLAAMKADERAKRLAWVLVWRNAHAETDRKNHFYAPFPGHPSAADFVNFRRDSLMAFEGDVQMYRN